MMLTCQRKSNQTLTESINTGARFPHKTLDVIENTHLSRLIVKLKALQIVLYMRKRCLVRRNDANLSTKIESDVNGEYQYGCSFSSQNTRCHRKHSFISSHCHTQGLTNRSLHAQTMLSQEK